MTVVDRVVERVRRAPPLVVDAAIAAWIFGIFIVGLITFDLYVRDRPYPPWQLLAAVGLIALATLGVALGRRHLWAAYVLVLLALVGALLTKTSPPELALLVVLYTVSRQSGAVASLLALLAALAVDYLAVFRDDVWDSFRHLGLAVGMLVLTNWAWVALAWLAGRAQARRRAIGSDLARTVDELQ